MAITCEWIYTSDISDWKIRNRLNLFTFDPFEIDGDSDHIVEYQGELDPDKNYFSQFS